MRYTIFKDNEKELVIRKSLLVIILYYLLLVAGILFILPGILLLFTPDTSFFTNYILGFGLIILSAAILVKITEKKFPLELRFDHQKQMVSVKSHKKKFRLGYGEIKSFRTFKKKEDGYMLYFECKTGAQWDLVVLREKEKAEQLANRMNGLILHSQVIAPEEEELPDWVKTKVSPDRITYYWRDKDLFVQVTLVFIMIWGMSLAITFSFYDSPYQKEYLLAVNSITVLIAIYLGLLVFKAQKIYKVVRIGKRNIVYGISHPENSDTPAEIKSTFEKKYIVATLYGMNQLHTLYFSILLANKEGLELLSQLRQENPEENNKSKQLKDSEQLIKIDITGRDIIDIARLEKIIRRQLFNP